MEPSTGNSSLICKKILYYFLKYLFDYDLNDQKLKKKSYFPKNIWCSFANHCLVLVTKKMKKMFPFCERGTYFGANYEQWHYTIIVSNICVN
jgi:hypothetical protein